MKALVYNGMETLDYQDMPDPVVEADQHLVRIDAVGICGSDMHAYLGHDLRRPAPLILGHEAAGVVVSGPRDGERVTINPLVACGTCRACKEGRDNLCPERKIISMPPREGGFAQYVAMTDSNLISVPDHVTAAKASLAEPLACGWHTVRLSLAALKTDPGETLVLGGGAIGLGAALSLAAQGGGQATIVEPNATRRSFLRDRCGQNAIDPSELADDAHFDLVIDGVGYVATRATASKHVRPAA